MMLYGQVDQLKLIVNNQIKTLVENNQRYIMWEIANILKISKSSVENYLHHFGMLIALMFGFHIG